MDIRIDGVDIRFTYQQRVGVADARRNGLIGWVLWAKIRPHGVPGVVLDRRPYIRKRVSSTKEESVCQLPTRSRVKEPIIEVVLEYGEVGCRACTPLSTTKVPHRSTITNRGVVDDDELSPVD